MPGNNIIFRIIESECSCCYDETFYEIPGSADETFDSLCEKLQNKINELDGDIVEVYNIYADKPWKFKRRKPTFRQLFFMVYEPKQIEVPEL